MITGFNHIGIVVSSINETLAQMGTAFAGKELERIPIPAAGQISSMVQIGDQLLEVMEPTNENGTVGKYLAAKREGLHHISLRTDNFDEDVAQFATAGMKVFGMQEMGGRKFCFIHPKNAHGILYEVVEAPKD